MKPRYESFYQNIKPVIGQLLGLSRDAIHIHVGFLAFFFTCLIFRKKKLNIYFLLPGFIISVLMELKDLWDDWHVRRVLDFTAGFHDLINTNLVPVLVYILIRILVREDK